MLVPDLLIPIIMMGECGFISKVKLHYIYSYDNSIKEIAQFSYIAKMVF